MDSVPEIDVLELAARLKSGDDFVLMDVREPWELDRAAVRDPRLRVTPMSQLSRDPGPVLATLPRDAELLVLCHHGIRSATVTRWLLSQGWTKVFSVRGGIHDYALRVDRSVGMY